MGNGDLLSSNRDMAAAWSRSPRFGTWLADARSVMRGRGTDGQRNGRRWRRGESSQIEDRDPQGDRHDGKRAEQPRTSNEDLDYHVEHSCPLPSPISANLHA